MMASAISDKKIPNVSQLGFGFWFQWIIANAAGVAIGMAIPRFLPGNLGHNRIVIGAAIGIAIGVIQMFNLKQYVERANWLWVISSTIGWAITWVVMSENMGYGVLGLGITQFSTVRGSVVGLLVGLMQWFLLRNQFRQAYWWLIANIVGWTVGMASSRAGGPFGFVLAGAIAGAITGLLLIWLLRNPIEKNPQDQEYITQDEYLESHN